MAFSEASGCSLIPFAEWLCVPQRLQFYSKNMPIFAVIYNQLLRTSWISKYIFWCLLTDICTDAVRLLLFIWTMNHCGCHIVQQVLGILRHVFVASEVYTHRHINRAQTPVLKKVAVTDPTSPCTYIYLYIDIYMYCMDAWLGNWTQP